MVANIGSPESGEKEPEKREKAMRGLIRSLVTLLLFSFLISASVMTQSATAYKPPKIVSVDRSPETPNYDQPITITVQVKTEDFDVGSVILRYRINDAYWVNVAMSLDDERNNDDWGNDWGWWNYWNKWGGWGDNNDCANYVAEIPPQTYHTKVTYKVYVSDIHGNFAISELFFYVVGDFVPPVISDILQVPASPMPYETVTVSATVTEPPEASGVKNVILWYMTNKTYFSLDMKMQDGLWTDTIPGQGGGTTVKFFVEAFDNEGNNAKTSIFDYMVTIPNDSPVASFTESAETVYTGEIIDFDASESHDPDGTIISYHWDFGDGTTATGVSISHSYSESGTYTVTLSVTDDDGETGIANATKTVLAEPVPNQSPIAAFTESAETVYTDETISFDASESYDPDGTIVSYFWEFGDETTGNGVSVQHAYSQTGTYLVTLTVTDDDGATNATDATKTVLTETVQNQKPTAFFTESAEIVYTDDIIFFDASGSFDPDGSIESYFWDFGDGTIANGVSISHSYPQSGTYKVTLTVTDDDGATDTTSAIKTVLPTLGPGPGPGPSGNQKPIASFTESAETVYTGESIHFNASGSHDSDGSIGAYNWDFGDGSTGTGVTISHAYTENGSYTVTLTVTDNVGATDSAHATKTVLNRQPVASFTESDETVYIGETISFNASESSDPDGTIVSYLWDFGDGNTGDSVSVQHAYSQDGTYTVTLTVTDDDGATNATDATKTVLTETVQNQKPTASFTESAETAYVGVLITFNAAGSYDPDGTIVSYSWNFGDETTATSVSISHSYLHSGTFTVTLTVTDDDGATDTTSATKTVLANPPNQKPVASFTESAKIVDVGESISFSASGSHDPDGSIVSYHWDFGDGNTGNGISIQHAYSQTGTYIVTLTVTDNDGATDTASAAKAVLTQTETSQNQSPIASFTESAGTVSSSKSIHFDASRSHDPDGTIISYLWDFGDSNTAVGVEVDHAYEDDGTYTVTLTVIDNDGATGSSTSTKTVLNRPPLASFTENATTVRTEEVINFDASESYDPDGSIVSYYWDFGDGNTTTGVTSTHAYSEDGNYTVTLTVTDDDGASSSESAMKIVEQEEETPDGVLALSFLAAIGLGVAALTATFLYGSSRGKKKRKAV